MKKINIFFALMLIVLLASGGGYPAGKDKPGRKPVKKSAAKKIAKKEKPAEEKKQERKIRPVEIALPPVESFETPNGIKLFYIRDDLPQITIVVSAGFGKLYENRGNAGLSDLLAKSLSLGGSKKYPGEVMHRTVESIGGRLGISSSYEETVISIKVLARYAETAFDIIADLLENPNFEGTYIENARSLLLEGVRRKRDKPEEVAFEKAKEIIFNGWGYGAVVREDTLKSISAGDIAQAWSRYFRARNLIVGISTSLEAARVKDYAGARLGGVPAGERVDYRVDADQVARSLKDNAGKIFFVPKDIPQATIVVGAAAPSVRDDRIYPFSVMNYILGEGSFNSRLMREIRVKRGLSYAVQSIARYRKNTGVFLAYAQTKSETADLALSLMLDNIRLMQEQPVSEEEMTWARDSIRNSYIFEFDTSMNVLSKYIFLEYNGLPASFLTDYLKKIEGVDRESIRQVSRGLFGKGLVRVVVGNKSIIKKLKKYGEVVTVEP